MRRQSGPHALSLGLVFSTGWHGFRLEFSNHVNVVAERLYGSNVRLREVFAESGYAVSFSLALFMPRLRKVFGESGFALSGNLG